MREKSKFRIIENKNMPIASNRLLKIACFFSYYFYRKLTASIIIKDSTLSKIIKVFFVIFITIKLIPVNASMLGRAVKSEQGDKEVFFSL